MKSILCQDTTHTIGWKTDIINIIGMFVFQFEKNIGQWEKSDIF